jgi:microcystin-dependent protein
MKNKLIFSLLIMLTTSQALNAQVGVNILTPHGSAALQVESPAGAYRGMLTPSMTSVNRISISTGTNAPADGLVVYDVNHRMHYYYQAASSKWVSLSPLVLSTPSYTSGSNPSGAITTPSTAGSFSLGINTQNPSQALHVVGNSTVSGNSQVGGTLSVSGTAGFSGAVNIAGSLNVPGFPSNALVPAGMIAMFSGTAIPFGWGLCDGTIYGSLVSPDLRGRFIVGVDNYANTQNISTGQYLMYGQSSATPAVAPANGSTINYGKIGNKGGETGHALTVAEMASHTHNVTAAVTNGNFFGTAPSSNIPSTSVGTPVAGRPYLPSISISETATGGNQVHENRPPYYVLAFIIKLP